MEDSFLSRITFVDPRGNNHSWYAQVLCLKLGSWASHCGFHINFALNSREGLINLPTEKNRRITDPYSASETDRTTETLRVSHKVQSHANRLRSEHAKRKQSAKTSFSLRNYVRAIWNKNLQVWFAAACRKCACCMHNLIPASRAVFNYPSAPRPERPEHVHRLYRCLRGPEHEHLNAPTINYREMQQNKRHHVTTR